MRFPAALRRRPWLTAALCFVPVSILRAGNGLLDGMLESSLFVGQLQEDRRYTQLLDPRDPNQAENDSRYHGYRTDVQWSNTLHFSHVVGELLAVILTSGGTPHEQLLFVCSVVLNLANCF